MMLLAVRRILVRIFGSAEVEQADHVAEPRSEAIVRRDLSRIESPAPATPQDQAVPLASDTSTAAH